MQDAAVETIPSAEKRNGMAKWKVSILKAANREAGCSVAVAHAGIAAIEVEGAWAGTTNRTAPIEAVGPDSAERTTVAEAVARHGQFERGGKSAWTSILPPT